MMYVAYLKMRLVAKGQVHEATEIDPIGRPWILLLVEFRILGDLEEQSRKDVFLQTPFLIRNERNFFNTNSCVTPVPRLRVEQLYIELYITDSIYLVRSAGLNANGKS